MQADLQEYFSSMPWKAANRKLWGVLSGKFGVNGIPRLVILNADGSTLNGDAAQQIANDPAGQNFPWAGNMASAGNVAPRRYTFHT